MQFDSETPYWIELGLIPDLGPRKSRELLARYGLPSKIFSADFNELESIVSPAIARSFYSRKYARGITPTLQWLAETNHYLVTLAEA